MKKLIEYLQKHITHLKNNVPSSENILTVLISSYEANKSCY